MRARARRSVPARIRAAARRQALRGRGTKRRVKQRGGDAGIAGTVQPSGRSGASSRKRCEHARRAVLMNARERASARVEGGEHARARDRDA